MTASEHVKEVISCLRSLQKDIVAGLGGFEPAQFTELPWQSKLGKGQGFLLEGGEVFERAGVSLSEVANDELPAAASTKRPDLAGQPYSAMGVSLVLHPRNPFVPTVHMNVRFFTTRGEQSSWWFGGGMDLTPYYGFTEDCIHFHTTCKEALDQIDAQLYQRFKKACDEYFFMRHRQQARGIGGIFFDDYNAGGFAASLELLQAVGNSFLPAYLPIVERRKDTPYTKRHRAHQLHRRGRYVEFNLLQDRGTLFGLQSGGRADAILMSMPPMVTWDTLAQGRKSSDDDELVEGFLRPRDWIAESS